MKITAYHLALGAAFFDKADPRLLEKLEREWAALVGEGRPLPLEGREQEEETQPAPAPRVKRQQ